QFIFRTPYIGRKRGYTAVYLHDGGTSWATVVWLRLWSNVADKSQIVLACHSVRAAGGRLHTGPMPEMMRVPGILPPGEDVLPLPQDAGPDEILTRHLRRLENESDL